MRERRTILCYGDSNTWGKNPESGFRHPPNVRWPNVLQKALGKKYLVISEGLRGRTFAATDPEKPHRTGITHLQAILESSDPVQLVIVMLGTNDIKTNYGLSPSDIARHLAQTLELIDSKKVDLQIRPRALVVCPPSPVTPKNSAIDSRMIRWPDFFSVLPSLYEEIARKNSAMFFNAGNLISSSDIDGYHLDAAAHKKFGEAIAKKVINEGI